MTFRSITKSIALSRSVMQQLSDPARKAVVRRGAGAHSASSRRLACREADRAFALRLAVLGCSRQSPIAPGGSALALIKVQYPDWRPSDHPDLNHWIGSAAWAGSESPWSVEQLLARGTWRTNRRLSELQGRGSRWAFARWSVGQCSRGLQAERRLGICTGVSIGGTGTGNPTYGLELIRGLEDSDLTIDGWRELLTLSVKSGDCTRRILRNCGSDLRLGQGRWQAICARSAGAGEHHLAA